jgi:hypothetical protein
LDLIEAGTRAATDGLAALDVEEGLELVFELVVELLLLPQAAIAPTDSARTGTTNQLLQLRIAPPRVRKQKIAANIGQIAPV